MSSSPPAAPLLDARERRAFPSRTNVSASIATVQPREAGYREDARRALPCTIQTARCVGSRRLHPRHTIRHGLSMAVRRSAAPQDPEGVPSRSGPRTGPFRLPEGQGPRGAPEPLAGQARAARSQHRA